MNSTLLNLWVQEKLTTGAWILDETNTVSLFWPIPMGHVENVPTSAMTDDSLRQWIKEKWRVFLANLKFYFKPETETFLAEVVGGGSNYTMNVPTPSFLHSSFRVTWAPAVHHVSKSAREGYGYRHHNNPLMIRGTRPIHLPQDRVMALVYDAAELRSDFIRLLRSRRSEEGTRVRSPFFIFRSLFLVRTRNVRSQTPEILIGNRRNLILFYLKLELQLHLSLREEKFEVMKMLFFLLSDQRMLNDFFRSR